MPPDSDPLADVLAVITAVDEELEAVAPPDIQPGGSNQKTAKRAAAMLVARNEGYHQPTQKERHALLVGFAYRKKVLYGASFDLLKRSSGNRAQH